MKITLKTGLVFSGLWIICKYVFFIVYPDATSITPLLFANMFFLLSSISVGLFLHKKQEGFTNGNTLTDIKAAMTSGLPYAIVVSLFIYVYYQKIDPGFNKHQIELAEKLIDKSLMDKNIISKMKLENPSFEMMSTLKIKSELLKGPRGFYKASSTAILSLLALMMLSLIYSIAITVIYRKIVSKGLSSH